MTPPHKVTNHSIIMSLSLQVSHIVVDITMMHTLLFLQAVSAAAKEAKKDAAMLQEMLEKNAAMVLEMRDRVCHPEEEEDMGFSLFDST